MKDMRTHRSINLRISGEASSRRIQHACAVAALALASAAPAQVTFTGIGDLPGGGTSSETRGVSNNGFAAGRSSSANGSEAFHYDGGLIGVGDLPGAGFFSYAWGISGDGTTVVGYGDGFIGGSQQAFRWTAATGMVGLGALSGGLFSSVARGTSSNGSIVVGYSTSPDSGDSSYEAFRWTAATGMVGLGDLPGGVFRSQAYACSADGSVIVGYGWGTALPLGREAFRWTAATGMVPLGALAGGGKSEAYGVSDDGTTVVGLSNSAAGPQAFRWTAGGGMMGLGDLAGGAANSTSLDTNLDGSVVVGRGRIATGDAAFIWTAATGIRDLRSELMIQGGVFLVGTWQLREATGISADGKTIVGWGIDPAGKTQGWIVENYGAGVGVVLGDLNGDGNVGGADLAILLAAWGPCAADDGCPPDLNDDNFVNGADLAVLLANWA